MYLFQTAEGMLALMCGTTFFMFVWVLALAAIAQHSYDERAPNRFPDTDHG